MGSQFYWIYDIAIITIIIAAVYSGFRKGFVRIVVGLISTILAFFIAIPLSGFVADKVYDSVVESKLKESIDTYFSEVFDDNTLKAISSIDSSKITVNGKSLSSLDLKPDSLGKITLDLNKVDISKSGIKVSELEKLGFSTKDDLTSLKLGEITIRPDELENKNVGDVIVANVITSKLQNTPLYGTIMSSAEKIDEVVPAIFGTKASDILNGNKSVVSSLIVTLMGGKESLSTAVLNNLVKPYVLLPMKSLFFIITFLIIILVLKLVTARLSIVNKIPLIGGVNAFLGGVAGIIKGVIAVVIVAMLINVCVIVSENSIIFLNSQTIEKTFIFKHIYSLDFLGFLNLE